jgi:hypothetical protein
MPILEFLFGIFLFGIAVLVFTASAAPRCTSPVEAAPPTNAT